MWPNLPPAYPNGPVASQDVFSAPAAPITAIKSTN